MKKENEKIIWKNTKCLKPFCSVCKEELRGNNSGVFPYECSCGIWKYDVANDDFDVLIEKALKQDRNYPISVSEKLAIEDRNKLKENTEEIRELKLPRSPKDGKTINGSRNKKELDKNIDDLVKIADDIKNEKTIWEEFDKEFPTFQHFYGEATKKQQERADSLEGKFTRDTKELPIEIKQFFQSRIQKIIDEIEKSKTTCEFGIENCGCSDIGNEAKDKVLQIIKKYAN